MSDDSPKAQPLKYAKPAEQQSRAVVGDDAAYFLPMMIFLGFIYVGSTWPKLYVASYVARVIAVAAALYFFRRQYTPIRWNGWWLGLIVGVVGIFQWVGQQHWLEHHFGFFKPDGKSFNPAEAFATPTAFWSFVAVRLAGAVLVVPVMEELFWRDFLWRQFLAPADFKLAAIGEWGWTAFLGVAIAFSTVHGIWFPTAVVWGLMIGLLLLRTKSIGACIIAHATTNLLLGVYVLIYHEWSLW